MRQWDGETLYASEGTDGKPVIGVPVDGVIFEIDGDGLILRDGTTIIPWDELRRMLMEPRAVQA